MLTKTYPLTARHRAMDDLEARCSRAAASLTTIPRSIHVHEGRRGLTTSSRAHPPGMVAPANQVNRATARLHQGASTTTANLSPEDRVWRSRSSTLPRSSGSSGPVRERVRRQGDLAVDLSDRLLRERLQHHRAERGSWPSGTPGRFIANGSWDHETARPGWPSSPAARRALAAPGREALHSRVEGLVQGLEAQRPMGVPLLREVSRAGISNIQSTRVRPSTAHRDAFDVADVDDAATAFPDELHRRARRAAATRGLLLDRRTQEPNVYGGLAVAMPFIHSRPRYFRAQIVGELLYWIGEDRITFASDYTIRTHQ